jgi:hypothetical protein
MSRFSRPLTILPFSIHSQIPCCRFYTTIPLTISQQSSSFSSLLHSSSSSPLKRHHSLLLQHATLNTLFMRNINQDSHFKSVSPPAPSGTTQHPPTQHQQPAHEHDHGHGHHAHDHGHGHHDAEEPYRMARLEKEAHAWWTPKGFYYRCFRTRYGRALFPLLLMGTFVYIYLPYFMYYSLGDRLADRAVVHLKEVEKFPIAKPIMILPLSEDDQKRQAAVEQILELAPHIKENPELYQKLRTSHVQDLQATLDVFNSVKDRFHVATDAERDALADDLHNEWSKTKSQNLSKEERNKVNEEYYQKMRNLHKGIVFVA